MNGLRSFIGTFTATHVGLCMNSVGSVKTVQIHRLLAAFVIYLCYENPFHMAQAQRIFSPKKKIYVIQVTLVKKLGTVTFYFR